MASPLQPPTTDTCGTSETRDPNEQHYRKNPSIFRVPAFIANLNPKAYRPQVVSFGPYHYGEDHLLHMEEHKRNALERFLSRSGKTLKCLLDSLRDVARQLQESYDALDPQWKKGTGDQFLALMITDGCFMLEILRNPVGEQNNHHAPDDPIFNIHSLLYLTPYIRRDMLMLENQLPMLVLEHLVAVEEREGEDIHKLILKFYSLDARVEGRFQHVLDVFREGRLTPRKDQSESKVDGDGIIRSATELNDAGIQFKKSHARSLNSISFGGGVLRLPVITVNDSTASMFLNIMNFEGLHIGTRTEVTSYVTFMDNIINNEQDVALLHAQGIIQNALGSDKAVAELFNSLCKEVTLQSNNSLDAVQQKISAYCIKRRNRWRAYLNYTYFRNPWTILSLIAAIFLFALAIIQTVYAVRSYY